MYHKEQSGVDFDVPKGIPHLDLCTQESHIKNWKRLHNMHHPLVVMVHMYNHKHVARGEISSLIYFSLFLSITFFCMIFFPHPQIPCMNDLLPSIIFHQSYFCFCSILHVKPSCLLLFWFLIWMFVTIVFLVHKLHAQMPSFHKLFFISFLIYFACQAFMPSSLFLHYI